MTYRGHIKNGQIVLDEPLTEPDGTRVTIDVSPDTKSTAPAETASAADVKTVWDGLLELAGTAEGLPPDFAAEHDHYIHGTPKRNQGK